MPTPPRTRTGGWLGRVRVLGRLNEGLKATPQVYVALLSLNWIASVGFADYWTGPERSMLIFYLIPITLGTWFLGRDFGLLLAVLSITSSSIADLASGLVQVRYWNEAVGLSSYTVFVALLSRWRALVAELDARVRLRTAALEAEMAERTRLEREMSQLTERERRRLAHDLHDSLCQHLTGTALAAQTLSARLAAHGQAEADHAERVVALVEAGIDLTRDMARGLLSPDLEGADLVEALQSLAATVEHRFEVACEFHRDAPELPRLSAEVATKLYRIAQEATTNAGKHGRPSRIIIELDHDETELRLNVFDNGCGLAAQEGSKGLGLCLMRHAAGSIGATFDVARNRPGGTVVRCHLKLEAAR